MEQMSSKEHEEPPGTWRPPHPWEHVPPEQWNDWRWQLSHRLNSIEDLEKVINLTPSEVRALASPDHFRVDITPYFATLMDPDDSWCPIRRQVVPTDLELVPFEAEMGDSLAEDAQSPVPGLVHRYPDRVLMLVTTQCASYCRYCTRSRVVGNPHVHYSLADFQRQIEYIAANPQVRDVLISGGDPLTLPQRLLEQILAGLHSIPHVEVVRIGTRVPVFLPQRIDDDLVNMLKRYHPLWMNIHFNHPKEITPEVETALARLADAGIPLGSQSVLMAGINDCPNIMKDLVHKLVRNRVRPYYIYQCDLVHGAGHFRTPVSVGIQIIESLRGHTSGFAVPTFVIDAPHGGGKVPIMPNYLLSQSPDHVVVRNFEGFISAYAQPETSERHDPSRCASCRRRQASSGEEGQEGIAALLNGERVAIEPEGFEVTHQRLTRIRWAPIKAAITSNRDNSDGQEE
jgi:lysine 2,3-aminomutase